MPILLQELKNKVIPFAELCNDTNSITIVYPQQASLLSGKTFCITGPTDTPRKRLQEIITEFGGEFKTSVTAEVTHVICNDVENITSKLAAAVASGKKIITEKRFIMFINKRS